MKVKIGTVTIQDATVKRFIDLQSGLALSMIHVSYTGKEGQYGELIEAFESNTSLPFECDILKTQRVLVHGFGYNKETKKGHFILQEWKADVSCGYRLIHTKVDKEIAIIVPENLKKTVSLEAEQLRKLPYIRFILKKDIPKELFE